MILRPPPGQPVDLCLGRIEALRELGGELVEPEIRVGERALRLPVTLRPEQYLETGDPWGSREPGICRVFDADGNELKRINVGPLLSSARGRSHGGSPHGVVGRPGQDHALPRASMT